MKKTLQLYFEVALNCLFTHDSVSLYWGFCRHACLSCRLWPIPLQWMEAPHNCSLARLDAQPGCLDFPWLPSLCLEHHHSITVCDITVVSTLPLITNVDLTHSIARHFLTTSHILPASVLPALLGRYYFPDGKPEPSSSWMRTQPSRCSV